MSEKITPAFSESLNILYPNQFILERNVGLPRCDRITFRSKNKHFGDVIIAGSLDEVCDEEDYFIEDENGIYDDAETGGLLFSIPNLVEYYLSPTEILDLLNKIFSDQLVALSIWTAPWKRAFGSKLSDNIGANIWRNSGLYTVEELRNMLDEKKLCERKKYPLWSGDYPITRN